MVIECVLGPDRTGRVRSAQLARAPVGEIEQTCSIPSKAVQAPLRAGAYIADPVSSREASCANTIGRAGRRAAAGARSPSAADRRTSVDAAGARRGSRIPPFSHIAAATRSGRQRVTGQTRDARLRSFNGAGRGRGIARYQSGVVGSGLAGASWLSRTASRCRSRNCARLLPATAILSAPNLGGAIALPARPGA